MHSKSQPALGHFALLLRSMPLEVVREAPGEDIVFWRDADFGTDAPVIAAAVRAEVDCLCTGDRRLLQELPQYSLQFAVVSPSRLLELLET